MTPQQQHLLTTYLAWRRIVTFSLPGIEQAYAEFKAAFLALPVEQQRAWLEKYREVGGF